MMGLRIAPVAKRATATKPTSANVNVQRSAVSSSPVSVNDSVSCGKFSATSATATTTTLKKSAPSGFRRLHSLSPAPCSAFVLSRFPCSRIITFGGNSDSCSCLFPVAAAATPDVLPSTSTTVTSGAAARDYYCKSTHTGYRGPTASNALARRRT